MKYLLSEIAAMCGGRLVGCDSTVRSVITDSRSVSCELSSEPIFVAMRGINHDSHDFVNQLVARGVRAFILEREMELPSGCGALVVESSIEALQEWAKAHRSSFEGRVVAITGSNGKTTVKEWIAQCVGSEHRIMRSPKSYNSQLGVALSLLMIEGDEQVAIIEAGVSQRSEMARLERIISPDIVIFTSIGDAHQEGFLDLEDKISEKLILGQGAQTLIYNGADDHLAKAIEQRFGDKNLIDSSRFSEQCNAIFEDPASRANAANVCGFFCAMGWSQPNLELIQPLQMRLEVKEGINDSILINDAYNLDINSLAIALDYARRVAPDRECTLIISDIAQSSQSGAELYGKVAELVQRAKIDLLIGVGSQVRQYSELFDCKTAFYPTTGECVRALNRADFAGRVVLLKGGREWRFERISHHLERRSHTTTLEVDLDAMTRNLNTLRSRLKRSTKLMAMVKAGSYGAGEYEVAQLLHDQGVDYLAVAYTDEGVRLRERGITMPIVVLNADENSFALMIENRLEPEIYNFKSLRSFARELRDSGRQHHYPIHIKLNTGMNRLGFDSEQMGALVEELSRHEQLRVASIFSHLACADMPSEREFTIEQIARFDSMTGELTSALSYGVLRHLSNSAGVCNYPQAQYDMVRLGIGLYGYESEELTPVSTLKTEIVQLRKLQKGESVGYGRAQILERDSVIATIPIGYADGLDRKLGCGNWSVLIGGVKAPIVGRICMDSCMVDVTDLVGVEPGDQVVILSPAKGNDAEAMARVLGTISYEVLTSISGRVKRIYIKE